MTGTIVDSWTFSRATLTLLLSDHELGAMPSPFEAAYPYTTVAERAAFRERSHSELTLAGLLRAGALRLDTKRCLAALTGAPAGIVAMATFADGTLLARGCWHERGAVLARQDGDTVLVSTLGTAPLVDAIVALIPDAKPAAGTSVTVPGGDHAGRHAADRDKTEFALYDDFATPGGQRPRPAGAPAALTTMLSNPIVNCGAFVPFAQGKFLPALTWFDTRDQRGVARHFATSTVDRSGTAWTTYVPGDNARIAHSLRQLVEPLPR